MVIHEIKLAMSELLKLSDIGFIIQFFLKIIIFNTHLSTYIS